MRTTVTQTASIEAASIEKVSAENLADVLPLIRQYQQFYKTENISDSRNASFFSQFGESSPAGCQFLYRVSGQAVAFATVYFSYASSIPGRVAVLNDLFTEPAYRGQGIARKLLEHCREFAGSKQAARLQWLTAPDNLPAQGLYDSLNTSKSEWFFYAYNT